jgi:hypothetical protein
LKIHGGGYLEVFAKIPREVKAFRKNCQGVPYFGFYTFIAFLTRTAWAVFKYCGTKTVPLRMKK